MASLKTANILKASYKVALTVSFISLSSTFMISYSCYVSMKFSMGDYEPHKFAKASCFKRFLQIILLTIVGPFLFLLLELVENIKKITSLFGFLVKGHEGHAAVVTFFDEIKNSFTHLNPYQLESIEKQKKLTTLFFESFPSGLLQLSIIVGLLDIPELLDGENKTLLIVSFCLTVA